MAKVFASEVAMKAATKSLQIHGGAGYMDEYAGTEKDPKVLVIIHGKGAFGGHYGNIMQYALRSGLRVIVPDLPHYGMSGPGNLDKSPARTMQDMREVIYDLVVNQLGVKKAYYLGHSLGGQFVAGYALTLADGAAEAGALALAAGSSSSTAAASASRVAARSEVRKMAARRRVLRIMKAGSRSRAGTRRRNARGRSRRPGPPDPSRGCGPAAPSTPRHGAGRGGRAGRSERAEADAGLAGVRAGSGDLDAPRTDGAPAHA